MNIKQWRGGTEPGSSRLTRALIGCSGLVWLHDWLLPEVRGDGTKRLFLTASGACAKETYGGDKGIPSGPWQPGPWGLFDRPWLIAIVDSVIGRLLPDAS